MTTLDDIMACAEQQEGTSAISALGLALCKALVPDKSSLLVSNQSTNLDALQRSSGKRTVDFGGRHDLGKNRLTEAKEM